ncbi:MAG: acyl-[acyl-carrier-protein]--UDP-N-acetylglucosamine O-acyltransferase, partial [Planctomycetes bacterium]|nr:acyl-[acyl-carrier-protein]--UDP-N-acetylglucosamine O-acyltransferase [Planctomycetota bacterium]
MKVHPAAVVHPKAVLGENVEVGAFSLIDEHVEIGSGTVIRNNVTVTGHTTLGEGNSVFPGAALGVEPQDQKHMGED